MVPTLVCDPRQATFLFPAWLYKWDDNHIIFIIGLLGDEMKSEMH